jgi:hypothetical protein
MRKLQGRLPMRLLGGCTESFVAWMNNGDALLAEQLAGAAGLDSDTVDVIFARLVSSCHGTAAQILRKYSLSRFYMTNTRVMILENVCQEQLSCCACVCQSWAAASLDDALWRVLLLRRCGDGTEAMLEALEAAQRAAREPALSFRALYIRSATTRVLLWGHCNDPLADEDSSSAPRTPALFRTLSENRHMTQHQDGTWLEQQTKIVDREAHTVVRQVSAGTGFSCAVTWGGSVLCWGTNHEGQCGVQPVIDHLDAGRERADDFEPQQYIAHPNTLEFPGFPNMYALQVSCIV